MNFFRLFWNLKSTPSSSFSSSYSSSAASYSSPLSSSPPPPPPLHHLPRLLPLLLMSLLQNHSGLMVYAFGNNAGGNHQDQDRGMETTSSIVEVVSGFNASIPCTIRIPAHDSPLLTLWYIGDDETPVYSYDQRTGVSGTSWADPRVFGGRAHYLAHLSPPALFILRVGLEDAHSYRCRIDFHNSNSQESWARLRVIVPPERVVISKQASLVVPGQREDVVCTALGGTPSPTVVWLQEGRVVDRTSSVGHNGIYNRLEVPATREDLRRPFTCQASNNNITSAVSAIYIRNVICGPIRVMVKASENPMTEGEEAEITCTALGSNPPAKVSWYHQGKAIQNLLINVTRQDNNETVSVLRLQPERHHHGRQLLCRAENPNLPLAILEDIITLNVAYRPHVHLKIGWPRRLELLTEGSDLFLECLVDANPPPYKIKFFQNGLELSPNETAGVIIDDATLAIQHVTRLQSGHYHCNASNVQGDAASKNISISVRYIPICAMNASKVEVSVGEMTNVTCTVYAYPTDVNYTWTFVNKAKKVRPHFIDSADYTCDGLSSTLYLTPRSVREFGVISCYATNNQGIQQQPCTFTLIPAGPPERVGNCSIAKVTSQSIGIICSPLEGGGGGGVNRDLKRQYFHQVRLASTGELVFNRSSTEASLEVHSLRPGQRYVVSVTAFNSRGRSPPRSLNIQTLQEAEMHISLHSQTEPRPMMWVIGLGAGVMMTLAVLFLVLWKVRYRHSSHTLRNRDNDFDKPNNTDLTGDARGMGDGLCVNGLMQHTIYDATGRYRGFAHMQQVEGHQSCGVTTSTPPEKETLQQSSFSQLRKESLLKNESKGSAAVSDRAGKYTKEAETSHKVQQQKDGSKDDEVDENEMKKSGLNKWRTVLNHISGIGENTGSRFLDVCRLADSKHLQEQNQKSENTL